MRNPERGARREHQQGPNWSRCVARPARTRSSPGAALLPASGLCLLLCGLLLCVASGCSLFHRSPFASPPPVQNPMFIPPIDREFLWNQTVDAIDDYFRIEREDRVRLIAGVLTEGRIDTFPTIGSTVFEPWRTDSTPGYEKIHATLQSIRR